MLDLDRSRAALLLIDFQNDIARAGGKLAPDDPEALVRYDAAIACAARAAEAARAAGIPVLHVAVGRESGADPFNPHAPMFAYMAERSALVVGTEGFAFVDAVTPRPDEPVFVKRGVSALVGTELGPWLNARGRNTLVLTGLVSHWAIEGTARHASDEGYRAIALSDACTSGSLARHETAMSNVGTIGEVSDTNAFCAALR